MVCSFSEISQFEIEEAYSCLHPFTALEDLRTFHITNVWRTISKPSNASIKRFFRPYVKEVIYRYLDWGSCIMGLPGSAVGSVVTNIFWPFPVKAALLSLLSPEADGRVYRKPECD